MRGTNRSLTRGLLVSFITITFVTSVHSQPPYKKEARSTILAIAYFTESANNSINSLNGLLKKDNYRNRITTLNNPVNNDLGFSLKNEIMSALKPMLEKVKKTDRKKFRDVIENFLDNPEENGISSVKKYLPMLGIFSTVLSLVGNLVVTERNITTQDLDEFVSKVQKYFSQYEKLIAINEQFAEQLQELVEKSDLIKEDLKEFLIDCICTTDNRIARPTLKEIQVEALIQRYYDPQKLQSRFDTCSNTDFLLYPSDAATSVKLITSGIKRLQKEFETLYNGNYRQLKELIGSLKNSIPDLNQDQFERTNQELDKLYNDSRQADTINLNITQVEERMNTVCRILNTYR